jgi:hypothetical protein
MSALYRECSGPVTDRDCGAVECSRGAEPDWDRLDAACEHRRADWGDACRACREGCDAAVDRAVAARHEA